MPNHLKMALVEAILRLHQQGWSNRRIARELGVHRETVARHIRRSRVSSKPANAPIGSEDPKSAIAPTGSDSKPANAPTGSDALPGGRRSACEAFRPIILAALERGFSAQRIYQDLISEHGFAGSYWSVRRFVRRLGPERALPFRRIECEPGEEAQVDFGSGAPVLSADGKRRRPHLFRVVLSYSRKAYSEVVYRQTTDEYLRCLENAFHYFRGVPRVLIIDNLRAAVSQADWYDPELNPKVLSFCEHYGLVIRPHRPYTPRHKGKVERVIGYVKDNALKGRAFGSLEEENRFLLDWEATVADTRIHGTTRKQVGKRFEEEERSALQPLPAERFPCFREAQRIVHRDGHVEVDKAYYSAPPEYVAQTVWVRWDSRLVRIYNLQMRQIALHAKHEAGRFSTRADDIASKKRSSVERGATWFLNRCARIGIETGRWAKQLLEARGVEAIRVLVGLVSLTKQHRPEAIEQACRIASSYGDYRLRTVRRLLKRPTPAVQLELLESHAIIRDLSEYAEVVARTIRGRDQRPQFPPPDPHPLPSSLLAGDPRKEII